MSLLTLLSLTTACSLSSNGGTTPQGNVSLQPSDWAIQYSPGMPSHPAATTGAAWTFNFPTDQNYDACVDDASVPCKSVHYVTTQYSLGATHSAMTAKIRLTFDPGTSFNYKMQPDNTCTTPANVRLFFQRKNDDMQGEFYRWWSNPVSYELGSSETGTGITMTVPLTPDQWSSVNGKFGNQDAEASAGFQDALLNVGRVGMTFGGGCFFGHGVNVTGGAANLSMIDFSIR